FSSRRRHTRSYGDWSSDVCSSDLLAPVAGERRRADDRVVLLQDGEPALVAEALVEPGRPLDVAEQQRDRRLGRGVRPRATLALEIGRASCRERVEVAGGAGLRAKR